MRAEEIITIAYYNEALLLQLNQTHLTSFTPVFHSSCVNLSLFKDLYPCRHAPLLVTDYEK